jgi:ATP-binding cassette subfamily B protein
MSNSSKLTDRAPASRLSALLTLAPFMRPYRWLVLAALTFLLVAAAAALMLPRAVGAIIDHGFSKADAAFVDRYFLGLIAVAAVLAIASATRYYFVSRLGEAVVADLRKALYGHLLKQELGFFETQKVGDLLSRLSTDTELIQTVVGSSVSVAARNLVMLVGSLLMLILTSPRLSLMIVLGIPLVVAPIFIFGRRVQRLSKLNQDQIGAVAGVAGEALSAMETVHSFSRQRFEQRRYDEAVDSALLAARRRIRARALLIAAVILLVFSAIAVTLWAGAKAVLANSMSGGELGQFVLYAVIAAGAVGALAEVMGELSRAAGASERLREILRRTPAIVDDAQATFPWPPEATVSFRAVSFSYASRPETKALDGLSFNLEPGETVAVVGPSGAGKSTLAKLLLRHYIADTGVIAVSGLDVRRWPASALREAIAIVPQEPVLFAASVLDNIRYAKPDAEESQVRAAARDAEALEFIEALPEGFATQLGERGVRLSGGQKQRIAIARALLKQAPILLLDEATSHLDAKSEHAVQRGLERLMHNRTVLVIAHRLATVQRADRILVLDGGRLVAQGNHAELLAQGGLYADFARLQLSS